MLNKMISSISNIVNTSADNLTIDSDAIFESTSTNNIAIGLNALDSTGADSDGNIGIGVNALTTLTTGDVNVVIGHDAGSTMNAGGSNVLIGAYTGANLAGGSQNTIVGYNAFNDADGNETDNTAIGYRSMEVMTNEASLKNTAVGSYSMAGITTASVASCVAIGYEALKGAAATSEDGTVAIGASALAALTTGAGNLAIGYQALSEHTTGARNIAIGSGAMDKTGANDCPTSTDNIFIGVDAGGGTWATNDCNYNIGIGTYALDAAMNGALGNTAIGHGSGSAVSSGHSNTLLGSYTGDAITSGYDNTAIGYNTDCLNTGAGQVGLGTNATTTMSYETRIGHYGAISWMARRIQFSAAHDGANSVIAEVFQIPLLSVITKVTCVLVTKSTDLSTYSVNLSLSTETGTGANGALVTSGITASEILGAGANNTYQQNSGIAMAGTAADINCATGATDKTVYTNYPNTTIVGTSDTYLYICNAVDNGTDDSSAVVTLDIYVEFIGRD